MIRKPQELTEPIRSAVDHKAVFYSHLLLAIVIAAHTAFDPESTRFEINMALGVSAVLIGLILLRVFDLTKLNIHPRLYLTVYQISAFLGITFVSSPGTPYVIALFLIVVLSNLYYGSKGVWISVACFGVTTLAKYIYLSATIPFSTGDKLNVVAAFFVFAAVCSVYVNVQKVFDWDRARLHETLKEEAIEQKRLVALINNMTESVLVLDKEGQIRVYNAAALAMFNTNENLNGKRLKELVKLEDSKGAPVDPKDLMPESNKPMARDDVVMRYGTDDFAAISVVATPIRPNFGYDDEQAGFVVTMRDITREKSLEQERDEFISVISHELRTPVTVVEAGVSNAMMLIENTDNSKLAGALKTAHDQSVYLANMLNDLSTFARAEKGTLEMKLERINPRDLLNKLNEDYQNEAKTKGLSMNADIADSTPDSIVSSHLYIREILQNFITNAIKYSDKGTITLRVRPEKEGVMFSVADEGIGIAVTDQKKVFNKFFRAEDYRTRSTSGTGLGLYITKKLAKLMDATFDVQSEVGKGSTFSIYVPDKSEQQAEMEAHKHHTSNEQPHE